MKQHERRQGRRKRRNNDSEIRNHYQPPSPQTITILKPSNDLKWPNDVINIDEKSKASNTPSEAGCSNPVPTPPKSNQQPQVTNKTNNQDTEELMNSIILRTPKVMHLIDKIEDSISEHPSDFLFTESICPGVRSFTVIGAVGTQSVGKSSLLNKIADQDVFLTHLENQNDSPLKHITKGIDLHITKERLFLLDTQPLVSASLLDEHIDTLRNPSNVASEISDPETYIYISSMQLFSFLLTVCDYVVVISDWIIDIDLIKLMSTSLMMVPDDAPKADIVIYLPKANNDIKSEVSCILQSLLGGEFHRIKGILDTEEPISELLKLLTPKEFPKSSTNDKLFSFSCEKSWFVSAQRTWENIIKKSSLYSDYARMMP